MKKLWGTVEWFLKKAGENALDAWAGQSAFFIVISVFPTLLLVVSISRSMGIAESALLNEVLRLLPAAVAELVFKIFHEAVGRTDLTFASFSAVAALWGVSRSVYALIKGLNAVYDVRETRHFMVVRVIAFVYTLALFVLIAAALVLLVFWQSIAIWLVPLFPSFQATAVFILSFRFLGAAVVFALFFLLLYKVLPNHRVRFSSLLPGAVFSSLGWLVFSRLFSFYIENFSNYASLYGSLTAVVLLMLWLYVCMYILFLGGEVNVWLKQKYSRR